MLFRSKQRGEAGLFGFIYLLGAQPLSCFSSLAFGRLQSFRDETDLAGSFFVPPPFSLGVWDGWEECRFMTALEGVGRVVQKVSAGMIMPIFSLGQHCATNSFGATRSPAPAVPSLSLCRLELAGAGTLKFQHGLYIPPNYYALLLRPSSPWLGGSPSLP